MNEAFSLQDRNLAMSAARNAQVAADVAALVAPAVNAVLDPWRAPTSVVLALADALEGKPIYRARAVSGRSRSSRRRRSSAPLLSRIM